MTKNSPKMLKIRYCQFLLNVVSKGNLVLGDKSVANCLTIKVFLLTHVQMFLIAPFFLFQVSQANLLNTCLMITNEPFKLLLSKVLQIVHHGNVERQTKVFTEDNVFGLYLTGAQVFGLVFGLSACLFKSWLLLNLFFRLQ